MDRLTAERYGIRTPAEWQALRAERPPRRPEQPPPAPPLSGRWLPPALCEPMTDADRANGERLLRAVMRASKGRGRQLRSLPAPAVQPWEA
jgi:hypothetical protein